MLYLISILGTPRARQPWLSALFALLLGMIISPLCIADAHDDYFKAAKQDNKVEIQSLLKRGINPNLTEPQRGESALMLAAREGSMKVLLVLLNANGINIDLRAKNGDTALMIASFKKNKPAVEALLAKGAQVNNDGWTALHYAAAAGDNEIVHLLLKKSAEIDATSPNLTTPLMMAAGGGFIYTVKALLDAGADLSRANEQGLTAIDFAKRGNHPDIVEGLTYRQKRAEKRAAEASAAQDKQERPLIIDGRLRPLDE
jgi:uncharacterized protein